MLYTATGADPDSVDVLDVGAPGQLLGVSSAVPHIPEWQTQIDPVDPVQQYYTYVFPDQANKNQSMTANNWVIFNFQNATPTPPYSQGIYSSFFSSMVIPVNGVWEFAFGGNFTKTAAIDALTNYCTTSISTFAGNGIYPSNGGSGLACEQKVYTHTADVYSVIATGPVHLNAGDGVYPLMFEITPQPSENFTGGFFSAVCLSIDP